jgi:hypothetical protein
MARFVPSLSAYLTPWRVERKITAPTEAGGRKVDASKDEPRYLVKGRSREYQRCGGSVIP